MNTNGLHVLPEIFSEQLCCADAVCSAPRPGLELEARSLESDVTLPYYLWLNS